MGRSFYSISYSYGACELSVDNNLCDLLCVQLLVYAETHGWQAFQRVP